MCKAASSVGWTWSLAILALRDVETGFGGGRRGAGKVTRWACMLSKVSIVADLEVLYNICLAYVERESQTAPFVISC